MATISGLIFVGFALNITPMRFMDPGLKKLTVRSMKLFTPLPLLTDR